MWSVLNSLPFPVSHNTCDTDVRFIYHTSGNPSRQVSEGFRQGGRGFLLEKYTSFKLPHRFTCFVSHFLCSSLIQLLQLPTRPLRKKLQTEKHFLAPSPTFCSDFIVL
ncbi:unnamed protein product [Boreogadus saida]